MKGNNCIIIRLEGQIASGKTKLANEIKTFIESTKRKVIIQSKNCSSKPYLKMISNDYDVIILDD